ncbi:MAG: hypothetical protein WKF41_13705 [Gaiellaceae bacterium]
MADILGAPESEDDLYLARADEVEPYRPALQGDVFRDVTIPGIETEHEYAMVIMHPCSMRRGPALLPRIQMIPVASYQNLPFDQWPLGHSRVFPLPNLLAGGKNFAASFLETGMVASAELQPDRRVATLTENGVMLLQQRYVHYLTRVVMQMSRLRQVSQHILVEAELQEDWCADLVPPRTAGGETLATALEAESKQFHDFITHGAGDTLQEMLQDPVRQSDVRRRVRQEITRRRTS